jgi:hypothetical protein
MALGSTQPLTEMSTRTGGKGGRWVRLTTLPPRNPGTLTSWNPLGISGPVTGLIYFFFNDPIMSILQTPIDYFLGAFAKFLKATISFAVSVGMSVTPHGTTWLPLDGFLWNIIFKYFFENLSRLFKFHWNLMRIMGTLRESLCTFLIISRSVLLKMNNFPDEICGENQNTHFTFSIFF